MNSATRGLARLLWSELPPSFAGLFLVYESLLSEHKRSQQTIIVAAAIVVGHSVLSFFHQNAVNRNRLLVHGELIRLLGSLSTFGSVELFKIELYFSRWQFGLFKELPWAAGPRLARGYSISLISTVGLDDSRLLTREGPAEKCRRQNLPQFWSPVVAHQGAHNLLSKSVQVDGELLARCGGMRCVPVTDGLGQSVIGVLVVHVEPRYCDQLGGTLETDAVVTHLASTASSIGRLVRK